MTRLGYCHPCGENGRPVDAVEMVDGDPHCQPCAVIAKQRLGSAEAVAPQPEPKRVSASPEFCSRGCGRPTHRGQCPNVGRLPQNPRHTHPERGSVPVQTPSASTHFREYADKIDAAIAKGTVIRREDGQVQHERIVIRITTDDDLDKIRSNVDGNLATIAAKTEAAKGKTMDTLVCEVIDRANVPQCEPVRRISMGRAGAIWERLLSLPAGKAMAIVCRDRIHVGQTARGVLEKAKARDVAVEMERGALRLYVWRVNA